ncbi:MAG: serine/threonine protein kinase [Deltaproteobacteria bacterium]|nr:serine/threonine protein kinase [Deltaproteobacteria bacterium]
MAGTSSPHPQGSSGAERGRLPAVGTVIAGKYQIVRVLGEGGMGIVYEATHLRLRQRVAVKMLLPSMLDHTIVVSRFEREARSAGQLRSRHVARVMDVDQMPDGLPYMVMEYLEGHDLQLELERRGHLPYEEVVDYVLQACAGMMEAHGLGIVHRDLKPSNLFLAVDGDMRVVKVLDFGISKVQSEGDAKLTSAESVMGTAMYMSPEQVRSSGTVDARSDVWSLGVILFELLTGRPPWIGTATQVAAAIVSEDPPDLRGLCHAPIELMGIVTRALQRNPDARFGSVKDLAMALAPLAPAGGAGRIIADSLSGTSGSFSRSALRSSSPSRESHGAATALAAPAVSESRTGPRDGGTAPGWSQPSATRSRGRTMAVLSLAFVVALVVLGGGAALYLRGREKDAGRTAATAPVTATAPPSATTAAVDPPPPQLDPPPPPTTTGASSSPPASNSASRAKPVAGGGVKPGAKTPGPVPSAKPAPTAPPPTPAPNPTIL